MSTLQLEISKEGIEDVIKSAIRDSIKEEFFKIRLGLVKEVSRKEMAEIEEIYGEPDKDIVYSEIIKI